MSSEGHLLQSSAWGELKKQFGWTSHHLQTDRATAQVLFRQLPFGLTIAYIPKGPTLDWRDVSARQAIFTLIQLEAKKRGAIFLKVEPNLWQTAYSSDPATAEMAQEFLTKSGFIPGFTIQPATSAIVDISSPEDEILATMKQKTRYNIRLAGRKGVTIRQGQADDVAVFYELSQITAERDEFGVHSLSYYQRAYELFAPDRCVLLIAEYEGDPLAALMVFRQATAAYYFYGASSNEKRNLMPSYLLQWEAMRWAKCQGCLTYDLWGVPDADPETLEAEFQQRSDGLWGVYRFKRGFGGQIKRALGAYDYVYHRSIYRLYRFVRQRRV